MAKNPLTPAGFARLEAEMRRLAQDRRPDVVRAVSAARELGDLSENAEYHAAKEELRFIDRRLGELSAILRSAEIIDPVKVACDTIKFGATCRLADAETGEEMAYQIVGKEEADLAAGKISNESPIARALLGKKVGAVCTFHSPRGERELEILEILYK